MNDPSAAAPIVKGTRLIVTTAMGDRLPATAGERPVRGRDFPVVWVRFDGDDRPMPWPLDAVEVAPPSRAEVCDA